ncbi:MAG: hypothetical protein GWN01_04650 [Nitrosopumilaceae archaeon]|nr:hypothetical protein [Nitrosopumilaceae archaeon]NIU00235.1 hypothetical protein [Nitrosopumilaceae archaeon]NIU86647.1 hypothetical protein [Nitrosopumilaceae archaeon]NIV65342.1 hypothetical protein [Nitrosopumilaceae archaeon]NIX60837.1 hypothetical protein [Nitrosopumilaceae archaeon]
MRYKLGIECTMTCFCGCESFEKNHDGSKLGCVRCGHGRQNHEEEFRAESRRDENK